MTNELKGGDPSQVFDYKQVDEQTADFLRRKETNMREIVGKAYTDLGRELKEAQERLSSRNKYEGVFDKWVKSIGMNKAQAHRLMNRYELVTKCDEKDLLEDLPVSLTYEIAKPSAESTPEKAQAKAEVLAGNIDTLKEYRERIKELEQENEQKEQRATEAERQADIERKQRERLEGEFEQLSERPPEIMYETKTEYVEIDNTPHDYEEVKRRLEAYNEKFGDIRNYDDSVTATHVQDMITATMSLTKGVRDFVKRFSYMSKYKDALGRMDDITKREYNEAVKALHDMADSFEYVNGDNDRIIINQ